MAESNSQPVICPCGFFGSAQTLGLCSKCYRESGELREQRNVFVNSDLRSHNSYNNPNNNDTFNNINSRNTDEDEEEEEDDDEDEEYEEHLSNVESASPSSSPFVLSPSSSSAIVSSIPSITDISHAIIQKTINTISNKSEKSDDIIPTPKNVSSSNQNVFQYSANNNTPITPDNKNNSKTNNTSTNSNTPINDNTPTNDKTLTNNTPTPTNSKTATHNNIPKAPHLDYTPDLQKLKPNTFPRPQSDSMILRNVKRRYADAFSGCGNLPSCSSASVLATPMKSRKKCSVCNIKLDLALQAIGKCKCELSFCSQHRLPEQHECTYDHKEWSRNEARTKMVVFKKHVGTALKRLDNDC